MFGMASHMHMAVEKHSTRHLQFISQWPPPLPPLINILVKFHHNSAQTCLIFIWVDQPPLEKSRISHGVVKNLLWQCQEPTQRISQEPTSWHIFIFTKKFTAKKIFNQTFSAKKICYGFSSTHPLTFVYLWMSKIYNQKLKVDLSS